tara:strand:- start:207 stop:545 length:339 start_codon:yes stop_codon:yes gene_type:complete
MMTYSFLLALSLLTNPITNNEVLSVQESTDLNDSKSLTITWNEELIDELELRSEYNILIPSIMTEGATQIHLNNLIDGNYFLILKSEGNVRAIKEFKVENMKLLAMQNINTK